MSTRFHGDEPSIHKGAYIQSSDPGAVGAYVQWVDTSTTPPTLKYRNSGNTAWVTIINLSALLSNPMTTAGDLIIGGSSGTPARLPAGSNGQYLKMVAGNPAWAAVYADPLTTKGDLLGYGSSTARLPVGGNGTRLVADSTQTLGVRWEAVVKEFTWTATGYAYFQAGVACTVDQAVTPNGTFSYDKASAGALGTFSSTSLPCALAAGDVLRVNCTALANSYGALVLKRTA